MSSVLRVAASIVLATCTGGCSALGDLLEGLPKPSASLVDVKFTDLSLTSLKLDLGVDVKNPYAVDIPVTNLQYALSSSLAQDKSLFSGSLENVGSIPAKKGKIVRVPVEIGFASLLELLPQVKRGSVVPYAADVKLGLDLPGGQRYDVPLRHEGKLPVPDVPTIELGGIKMEKLDLSGVTGVLSLNVGNPNEFAVALSKLTAAIEVSGVRLFDGSVGDRPSFAPGQKQPIDVKFSASALSAAQALLAAVKSGKASYKIAGDVQVDSDYGKFGKAYLRESETRVTN